jgi:DNA repair protein RadC
MKYIYPYRVSVVREHTDRYPRIEKFAIKRSGDIVEVARKMLFDAATERFLMFMLTTGNVITGFVETSVGSLNITVVHPRDVFRAAVINGAASVIFAHNHPSGNINPSREDFDSTRRLVQAGKILGIRVLDSLIIGDENFYSFADEGLISEYGRIEI